MANRRSNATKEILLALAKTGILLIAATSPYFAFALWKQILGQKNPAEKEREQRKRFSQSLHRLKQSRLILISEKEDGKFLVELTEKGARKVKEMQLDDLAIPKQKSWDEIWRIVIFDIPNKKRKARDALREKLKKMNFYQLQESVWVSPYPCNQQIEFLVELFKIYPYVNMLEAQKVKNDALLKKHFKLL